jgi:hypothetical protein
VMHVSTTDRGSSCGIRRTGKTSEVLCCTRSAHRCVMASGTPTAVNPHRHALHVALRSLQFDRRLGQSKFRRSNGSLLRFLHQGLLGEQLLVRQFRLFGGEPELFSVELGPNPRCSEVEQCFLPTSQRRPYRLLMRFFAHVQICDQQGKQFMHVAAANPRPRPAAGGWEESVRVMVHKADYMNDLGHPADRCVCAWCDSGVAQQRAQQQRCAGGEWAGACINALVTNAYCLRTQD